MTLTVPSTGLLLAMSASPDQGVSPLIQLIPFALVLAIFYFVIRRLKQLTGLGDDDLFKVG